MSKQSKKLVFVCQDWNDPETLLEELIDALHLFGIHITKDPFYKEGSKEGKGYIISRQPIPNRLAKSLSKKYHSTPGGFEL